MILLALEVLMTIVSANEICSLKLEQAVFKPKVCGVNYFKNLACELNPQVQQTALLDRQSTARLCLRFSKEHQVDLSILDAQGLDMCTLNNPTANLISQISGLLKYRSATDRKQIYDYYAAIVTFPSFPPIPAATSPDLDSIGMLWLYFYLLTFLDQGNLFIDPYIIAMLDYIKTYPNSGLQSSADLDMINQIAYIIASVNAKNTVKFMNEVLALLNLASYPFVEDLISADTVVFLAFLLQYATLSQEVDESGQYIELPPNIRMQNYAKEKNALLVAQGAAGIIKSFSQFMPINTVNEGICNYAYDMHLEFAKVVRIVFSQSGMLK